MFTQEVECQFCSQTRKLAQRNGTHKRQNHMEVYDFVADADKAKE